MTIGSVSCDAVKFGITSNAPTTLILMVSSVEERSPLQCENSNPLAAIAVN